MHPSNLATMATFLFILFVPACSERATPPASEVKAVPQIPLQIPPAYIELDQELLGFMQSLDADQLDYAFRTDDGQIIFKLDDQLLGPLHAFWYDPKTRKAYELTVHSSDSSLDWDKDGNPFHSSVGIDFQISETVLDPSGGYIEGEIVFDKIRDTDNHYEMTMSIDNQVLVASHASLIRGEELDKITEQIRVGDLNIQQLNQHRRSLSNPIAIPGSSQVVTLELARHDRLRRWSAKMWKGIPGQMSQYEIEVDESELLRAEKDGLQVVNIRFITQAGTLSYNLPWAEVEEMSSYNRFIANAVYWEESSYSQRMMIQSQKLQWYSANSLEVALELGFDNARLFAPQELMVPFREQLLQEWDQ